MKLILPIFCFLCSCAYGQDSNVRNPFDVRTIFDQFKKEDNLDGLYTDSHILKVIADTLPMYTLDENSSWRDMKLVNYFYDSSKTLKKVFFRDGQQGSYYFYFQNRSVRKARVVKPPYSSSLQYYFTDEDNKLLLSVSDDKTAQDSIAKDSYTLLLRGIYFLQKFEKLL